MSRAAVFARAGVVLLIGAAILTGAQAHDGGRHYVHGLVTLHNTNHHNSPRFIILESGGQEEGAVVFSRAVVIPARIECRVVSSTEDGHVVSARLNPLHTLPRLTFTIEDRPDGDRGTWDWFFDDDAICGAAFLGYEPVVSGDVTVVDIPAD